MKGKSSGITSVKGRKTPCAASAGSRASLIQLKPQIAASEIKRKIEEAFRRSALIDASHVTVEANGGEVILRGGVRSWAERREAEHAAWAAPGVVSVKNEIVISPYVAPPEGK